MNAPPTRPKVRRGRNFLHAPGPTNVPDRVLRAMQRPAVELSTAGFVEVCRSCFDDLRKVFRTSGEVFIYAANGHGAWEAAVVNVLSPGDRVLVIETGHFAMHWAALAESLGVTVEVLAGDWRHAVDEGLLEARLRADQAQEIKAVMAVHTDTATAVTSDLTGIRRALDAADHPALLLVDAVASLATTDFRMDAWGVDVAVAAAQKGLMTPPGLSFVAAGPKALAAADSAGLARNYWDWRARSGDMYYQWFMGTAPEHLIYALRAALDMLEEEGLEQTFARHARLAEAVRSAVRTWGQEGALELNCVESNRCANGVTTVRLAEGHDARTVIRVCAERFDVSLGGGLGRLDGRCFRIAHMGWINEPMIFGALASVEATLRLLGIPHRGGGVNAAIARLSME